MAVKKVRGKSEYHIERRDLWRQLFEQKDMMKFRPNDIHENYQVKTLTLFHEYFVLQYPHEEFLDFQVDLIYYLLKYDDCLLIIGD